MTSSQLAGHGQNRPDEYDLSLAACAQNGNRAKVATAKAWIVWLGRGWPIWLALAAAALPMVSPWLRGETGIRFAGAAYQTLGVILVSAGINGKLKHFYRISLFGRVRRWLRESPISPKGAVSIGGHLTLPALQISGVITVERKLDHLSVDERIAYLHKMSWQQTD